MNVKSYMGVFRNLSQATVNRNAQAGVTRLYHKGNLNLDKPKIEPFKVNQKSGESHKEAYNRAVKEYNRQFSDPKQYMDFITWGNSVSSNYTSK